jgi:hypothetical protein
MALPLLMLAGAGILGGGQYLLQKADEKRSASMIDNMHSIAQNSNYGRMGGFDATLSAAQSIAQNSSLINRTSGDIAQMMQGMADTERAFNDSNAAAAQARQLAWQDSNEGHLASLQGQRQANQVTFGKVQDQARVVESLYNNGSLSGNNLQGMINAIARMQFPNEALNEGDINRVISGSPVLAQWQNKISGLTGDADKDLADSIYNMGRDLYKGFYSNYEAGKANVDDQVERMRRQGYLPTDRVDRRFGTFDPGYQWATPAQPPVTTIPPGVDPNDPEGEGFAAREAEANSRGRTLIDPATLNRDETNAGTRRRLRRGR